MNNIITIKKFSITFDGKEVIKDLSFEVKKGETFGLLGSNGSGKTTTIRALLGLYQPSAGELLINNQKFSPNNKTIIGYLPEERGLYKKETVLDTMLYFANLKNLKNPKRWIKSYLKRVKLEDKIHEKIEKLSSGQQQKIQLGITIMNNPEILILDEPTKGFDPVNRRLLMNIIDELKQKGATIIMITHYMDEVEKLCDRAILLKDGGKHAYGTIEEIKKAHNNKSLEQIFIDIYGGIDNDF